MKGAALILFLWVSVAGAEDEPRPTACVERAEKLTKPPAKCGTEVPKKFLVTCTDLMKLLAEYDKQKSEVQARCNATGGKANVASGKKARGAQADASRDASAMLQQNKELMEKCAGEMKQVKDRYQSLASTLDKEIERIESVTPPSCKSEALKYYRELKRQVESRLSDATSKEGEYKKGADAAASPASGNDDNANKMGGGSPGGGMPSPPQIPPKKQDDSAKKAAEEAARLKAQKKAQCNSERIGRDTKKKNCELEFRVTPGAVVLDYQVKQKECIDKADAEFSSKWGTSGCDGI